MPWGIWVAIGGLVLVGLLALGRYAFARRTPAEVRVERFPTLAGGAATRRQIIHVPGMLMHGTKALLPVSGLEADATGVLGSLRQHGHVDTIVYPGDEFVAERVRASVMECLARANRDMDEIILIGSSMGGLLATEVLAGVPVHTRHNIRIILVDSPFHVGNLRLVAVAAAAILNHTWLGRSPLWRWLPVAGRLPLPSEVQPGIHYLRAVRTMWRRFRGMRASLLFSQLSYIGNWRPPIEIQGGFKQIDYLQCQDQFSILKQPGAVKRWRRLLGDALRVQVLQAPHCGYLQQPDLFIQALERTKDT